jgi:dTDP-glucose 4,6-dehydratase
VALARTTDWLIGKPWLKRFVQIGSSEIFGAVSKPSNEETPPNPTTPYAISKLAGDYHLKAICKIRDFPMNILWPSNAYAPGQQLYRIIPRTILACMLDRQLPLQGGGKAVKSYLHATDLSRAIYLTAHKADVGQCYTVGPDNGISIRDLVYKIIQKLDKNPDNVVKITADRLGQDAAYLIDSTKIKTDLGWKQEISLDAGLDTVIDWVKDNLEELEPLSTEVFFQA